MEASFVKNWQKSFAGTGNKGISFGLENLKKHGASECSKLYFTSYLFYNGNRSMNSAPLPSPRGGAVLIKTSFKIRACSESLPPSVKHYIINYTD